MELRWWCQHHLLSKFDNTQSFLKHEVSQSKQCVVVVVEAWWTFILDKDWVHPWQFRLFIFIIIEASSWLKYFLSWGKLFLPITKRIWFTIKAFNVAQICLKIIYVNKHQKNKSTVFFLYLPLLLYQMLTCDW